jgi:carboxyl-terminal processing protease
MTAFVNRLAPLAGVAAGVALGLAAAGAPVRASTQAAPAPGVRTCRYVPGVSVPARMPADVANRPRITPPAPPRREEAPPGPETAARQLRVLDGLAHAVADHYVYADFRGHDWNALVARYRARVQRGMDDQEFYDAMESLISELGDEHSYFQSPSQLKAEQAALASQYHFVGVGALFLPIPGTERAAVMTVFPGGPAAAAALEPHDVLVAVDGGPIRDASGMSRTRGPAGTTVTMTVQRPGEPARRLTVTRRTVTGELPIDACIVPGTRIGYLFLPTLLDQTMANQVRGALRAMTADGALQGLVLDNRMNGGGLGSQAQQIMELFTSGPQGAYVTRTTRDPLDLPREDVGGSQTVPLVVLIDAETVSYGEILSGVLQRSHRATLVGGRTLGNVEQLRQYDLVDGSRLWLASATFQPVGLANGVWEGRGLTPDILLPTRWDLFTEADDPALARAVQLLTHRQRGVD